MPRKTLAERFWAKVQKTETCWLWVGAKTGTRDSNFRYGLMRVDGKNVLAHRISFIVHHKESITGLVVRHKCDTPACVNPEHLESGTRGDNYNDSLVRGRRPIGSKIHNAKLTEAGVKELRSEPFTQERLFEFMRRFNCSEGTVRAAYFGKQWMHVK